MSLKWGNMASVLSSEGESGVLDASACGGVSGLVAEGGAVCCARAGVLSAAATVNKRTVERIADAAGFELEPECVLSGATRQSLSKTDFTFIITG